MKKIKENLIEKSPELMKIEKTEVPKGIIKIGFEEPEPTIKKKKKPRLKPSVKEISKEEIPELPDLPKLPELPPILLLTKEEENVNIEKNTYQQQQVLDNEEIKIEDLEKEIKAKKKLLKLKKEEEKKRLEEEERIRLEEELKRIEEEKNKFIETQEIPKETQEVKLITENEILLKICPICNSKVKRKPVKQIGLTLIQQFKCKNKKCDFQKEISIRI